MAKKVKKVDPKMVAKVELSAAIANALREQGFDVNTDAEAFGFSKGTLVVGHPNSDVQVKFITPKAGLVNYAPLPEDEVDED